MMEGRASRFFKHVQQYQLYVWFWCKRWKKNEDEMVWTTELGDGLTEYKEEEMLISWRRKTINSILLFYTLFYFWFSSYYNMFILLCHFSCEWVVSSEIIKHVILSLVFSMCVVCVCFPWKMDYFLIL